MSNNIRCGCNQPSFVTYPYVRGAQYQCDCCTQMHQRNTAQYPSSGSMQENAFMIVNSVPYLLDNTTTHYGTKLSVSENIHTIFSRRTDPSCINMVATIDMTEDQIITNSVWKSFLEQTISSQFETLENVLPIQKAPVKFRLYFRILDGQGGEVYASYIESTVKDHLYHYTDINDYFVTSFKNVMVTNIPQVDYNGIYTLAIDRVDAYVDTIDTKNHIAGEMNQFYAWVSNDTHINVQPDTIATTLPDSSIMIASVNLSYTTAVQLNLTTRLKISFTAFMSNTIAEGDAYGVYKALYNPTEHLIEKLANDVAILTSSVTDLQTRVYALEGKLNDMYNASIEYDKNTYLHQGIFVWIVPGTVYQVTESYTTTDDPNVTKLDAFQADILAGKLILISNASGE